MDVRAHPETGRSVVRSLRTRFLWAVAGIVFGVLVGAGFILGQLWQAERISADTRRVNQEMHIMHEAHFAAQYMLFTNFPDPDRLAEMRAHLQTTRDEMKDLSEADSDLVRLVVAALRDPARYRHLLIQAMEQLNQRHHEVDQSVWEQYARFDRATRLVNIALLVMTGLGSILVIALPLTLVQNVLGGLDKLKLKIAAAEQGKDPAAIGLERQDEIGAIGRALDLLAAVKRAQEVERLIGSQLLMEQRKMADLANFAGGIAHEVGNPLTVLSAALDAQEQKLGECVTCPLGFDADLKARTATMREALDRISEVLRHIASFPVQGNAPVEPVDLNELLGAVGAMARLDERRRKIRFSFDFAPDLPALVLPRARVALALYGLVTAVMEDWCPESGEMKLATRALAGKVETRISVRPDNFCPLPDEAIELVETENGGRTALAPLRQSVRDCGGELEVSAGEGGGVDFRLLLPEALPALA